MGAPARVLVVDDSPTILKVVSAILARHGYEPITARDGVAGIETLKQRPIDLVLVDFVMPRMNGYQFCRELRSSAAHRTLPVVLMSAKGDKIRGQFVQQTGAVDAITKPFDARALVAVVEGALAKTAEGRARPVPEGKMMPDEDTVGGAEADALEGQKQREQRLVVDVASQIASAVVPSLQRLPAGERDREAALFSAVAKAITPEIVSSLALTIREMDTLEGGRELMSGDIAAIPLAEVLQVLQMQRQTGVLRVSSQRTMMMISFRHGLIDLVQSRGAADEFRLGRYLVEKGTMTRDELEAVLEKRPPAGKLLGDVLVESGMISREDLTEALTRQSSELIYDLLRWPFGRFAFTNEPFRPEAESAKLGLAVAGLVLEGFRRVDEWRLMEGSINFEQTLVVDPMALGSIDREKLSRSENLVLDAVNGTRKVSEIIKESSVGSFDAIRSVYQFLQSRVLRPKTTAAS